MKNKIRFAAMALTGALWLSASSCATLPDRLIWKNEDANKPANAAGTKEASKKADEISPTGLADNKVNPISPEEVSKTALSRPKVVKVEEPGAATSANKRYFEVVDERQQGNLSPVIDEGAKPVRIVTYSNNAIQKDYNIRFGVAWNRLVESLIDLPLTTLDRSSGVIITSWIYDTSMDNDFMAAINVGGLGGKERVRYRYNVLLTDRGSSTQIKVVPFAEAFRGTKWEDAKPGIVITNRLFNRLERELAVPLPTELF